MTAGAIRACAAPPASGTSAAPWRFLYATRERFPSSRVDLSELIGAALPPRGFSVDWYMRRAAVGPSAVLQPGPGQRVLLGGSAGSAWRDALAALRHLLALPARVAGGGYDFVMVRDLPLAAVLAAWTARRRGIPFFYWMSYPYPEADRLRAAMPALGQGRFKRLWLALRGRLSHWLLYRVVLPRADHVFVQSRRMLEAVAERGIAKAAMTPVPMGVNPAGMQAVTPSRDPRLAGREVLVYTGTLVRMRQPEFLLDVLHRLQARRPAVLLVLLGGAPPADMQALRERARALGLGGAVLFLGERPMAEAWSYVRAARVALSPLPPNPVLELGTPTKVVEYLALGRPVVASLHPDQSELLAGSGAGYCVEHEPGAFARAIEALLSDQPAAEAMAAPGPDYVQTRRSYAVLGEELARVLLELLSRSRRAATC